MVKVIVRTCDVLFFGLKLNVLPLMVTVVAVAFPNWNLTVLALLGNVSVCDPSAFNVPCQVCVPLVVTEVQAALVDLITTLFLSAPFVKVKAVSLLPSALMLCSLVEVALELVLADELAFDELDFFLELETCTEELSALVLELEPAWVRTAINQINNKIKTTIAVTMIVGK